MTNNTSNTYPYQNLSQQIYAECRSMASYAMERGKTIPAPAVASIEAFEELIVTEDRKSLPQQSQRESVSAALVDTHALLAHIIEPATPQTILLLIREQNTDSALKFLGPVSLVRHLMLAAIISLTLFIALLTTPYIESTTLAEDVLNSTGLDQLARLSFYISASGLGASFAALYKADSYISRGTYDPCYQASYWIRFLLGIIAGLLLALLISEKSVQSAHDASFITTGVFRPLLAILGGFSADLLHTLLSRMVDMFKSLFEGGVQTIIDAKNMETKTKLAGMEMERRLNLAQNLIQMQQQVGTEMDSEQLKQQINGILQNLMKT